jgi:predicted aspartyl protease
MRAIRWPEGTELVPFENLDGAILLPSRIQGVSRDTTGPMLLDTGAGFVALDRDLAFAFELADSTAHPDDVSLSTDPIPRLEIGRIQLDQVSPVLLIHGEVVKRVTDRPVLGLLGQRPFQDRAMVIDYRENVIAFVPSSEESGSGVDALLSKRAVAIPFRLAGDGKIVVRGRLSNPKPPAYSDPLSLIVDTGATKTVLFAGTLARLVPGSKAWRRLTGLSAPTLIGANDAAIVIVPAVALGGAAARVVRTEFDAAVIESDLEKLLSDAVEEPVAGLLGHSFLRRYRVVIDYPARMLRLDPQPEGADERPYEYSQVGIQIERVGGGARVVGVVKDSPAARAGILVGDEVVAIDGRPTRALDIVTASRRLEGPPGTRITLTLRRGDHERRYTLVRRQLL